MNSTPMPLFPRILVAVDASEPANWALDVAAELAPRQPSQVKLVHVVKTPVPYTEEVVLATPTIEERLAKAGEQLLRAARARLPESIQAHWLLCKGRPAEQILLAAEAWEADLIVMGTRARGRWAEFLLGSTAEEVIRRAACPVMTVAHPRRQVQTPGARAAPSAQMAAP